MVTGTRENKTSVLEEEALQEQIRDKAVLLFELDMMIMDYQREQQDLLMEIRQLRERLWGLRARQQSQDDQDLCGG